jgi:CDP-diglyceride synthetase
LGRTVTLTEPIKIWMSAHAPAILQGLILISAANGAPVLFARLLGARFARPIDGGIVLRDGRPLPGRSKTWRGLAAAVLLAACAAVLMSLPWQLGALAAASAMAGDCLSSFIKRRFGLEPSSMTLGLDQVPESLFPAVALQRLLAAWSPRRCLDRACILRRRVGDVAAPLRHRPTGSSLLRDVAHKLVQRDLRPIVETNRDDRGPGTH